MSVFLAIILSFLASLIGVATCFVFAEGMAEETESVFLRRFFFIVGMIPLANFIVAIISVIFFIIIILTRESVNIIKNNW